MIQSLKRQIEAMEKAAAAPRSRLIRHSLRPVSKHWSPSKRHLQKNLEAASAKLAAARLGENLEKDQQSEKLEIIEQPTVPQEPIKPNRPKVAALAVALALMAGAGLASLSNFGQGNPAEAAIFSPSSIVS